MAEVNFKVLTMGMKVQYMITDGESFVIADVCEYNNCNHEYLSKRHNINHFSLYKSSTMFFEYSNTDSLRAELLPRFVGVYDDVKQDMETHSLSYQSNDKATITKIVNEFKHFFGVN